MEIWRQFEKRILTETLSLGSAIVQIPNGSRRVGRGKTIEVKTDFDFAASVEGRAVFFDAKSFAEPFNFKQMVLHQKKVHQYTALCGAYLRGACAGYLIWFYDKGLIVWADVGLVAALIDRGDKSLDEKSPHVTIQRDDQPINLKELTGVTDENHRRGRADLYTRGFSHKSGPG